MQHTLYRAKLDDTTLSVAGELQGTVIRSQFHLAIQPRFVLHVQTPRERKFTRNLQRKHSEYLHVS